MKYLGIDPQKIKIGVFDFTSCEGCELQLANKEETLLDFLSHLEIINFREVSSYKGQDYDIAFIEGSITRQDEIDRVKDIRSKAKVLVALGSCACFGGVNFQKNQFEIDDVVREVYGADKVETIKTMKVADVVQVDLSIPGCPVNKDEVEKIVVDLVTGVDVRTPNYPVCVECKQNGNTCVVDMGKICLGPITQAGCGAVCPNHKVGCLGCRGPVECAKIDSLMDILKERGHTESQIMERVNFYNTFSEVINS